VSSDREDDTAWHIQGRYVENCNCDVICPCTWSNLSRPATGDDCRAVLAFDVERGDVDGVDVSGRTVVLAIQTPRQMVEGNWKAGLLFDQDASDEQMSALTKIFTGEVGGPMAALSPLIGEFLGVERAAIELAATGNEWTLRVGGDTELGGLPASGPANNEPVGLTGIVAHPAGPTLTVTPSSSVRWSLLGIDYSGEDRSGFTAPFSWAA
jgi:hypothetical protein